MAEPTRNKFVAVTSIAILAALGGAAAWLTIAELPATNESKLSLEAVAPQEVSAMREGPLMFEENMGQAPSRVHFLARGTNSSAYLLPDRMLVSTTVPNSGELDMDYSQGRVEFNEPPPEHATWRMELVGAKREAPSVGLDEQARKLHILGGGQHVAASYFESVRFEKVYPGIDVVYRGGDAKLEYDFEIAPGADPADIQLSFEGAEQIRIRSNGDLTLQTAAGEVRHSRPIAFQEGRRGRRPVEARFIANNSGSYAFEVGPYDHEKPLVIDPRLVFAGGLGGSGNDQAWSIKVGKEDFAYIAGSTSNGSWTSLNGTLPPGGVAGLSKGSTQDTDAFIVGLQMGANKSGAGLMLDMDIDRFGSIVVDEDSEPPMACAAGPAQTPPAGATVLGTPSGEGYGVVRCYDLNTWEPIWTTAFPGNARKMVGSGGDLYVANRRETSSVPIFTNPGGSNGPWFDVLRLDYDNGEVLDTATIGHDQTGRFAGISSLSCYGALTSCLTGGSSTGILTGDTSGAIQNFTAFFWHVDFKSASEKAAETAFVARVPGDMGTFNAENGSAFLSNHWLFSVLRILPGDRTQITVHRAEARSTSKGSSFLLPIATLGSGTGQVNGAALKTLNDNGLDVFYAMGSTNEPSDVFSPPPTVELPDSNTGMDPYFVAYQVNPQNGKGAQLEWELLYSLIYDSPAVEIVLDGTCDRWENPVACGYSNNGVPVNVPGVEILSQNQGGQDVWVGQLFNPVLTAFATNFEFNVNELVPCGINSAFGHFGDYPFESFQLDRNDQFPDEIGGVQFCINGEPQKLIFVAPQQLAFIADCNLQPGQQVELYMTCNDMESNSLTTTVSGPSPEIATQNGTGVGTAVCVNFPEGILNSEATPIDEGGVLICYGGGSGPTDPPCESCDIAKGLQTTIASITMSIGGRLVAPFFCGKSAGLTCGLDQWNLFVPDEINDIDIIGDPAADVGVWVRLTSGRVVFLRMTATAG
jgi:uncharacterized protein (TIGR03437 family)